MTLPMNMTLMTRTDVGPTVRPVDPCWTYVMAASLGCAALLLPEDLPFLCFGGILVGLGGGESQIFFPVSVARVLVSEVLKCWNVHGITTWYYGIPNLYLRH